jgi:hypothetical protein
VYWLNLRRKAMLEVSHSRGIVAVSLRDAAFCWSAGDSHDEALARILYTDGLEAGASSALGDHLP